jgi:SAM-dependent methyltransferase
MTMPADDLVPEVHELFDGTESKETFIALGNGFLWNALVARARLAPDHAVLDIGSGNGQKARPLTGFLSPDGCYRGFDIVRSGVEWCQARYARFSNFRFDLAPVRSDWFAPDGTVAAEQHVFGYPDDTFDVAFAASLFTHLQPAESAQYFRETYRVLKPGGRLFATCFLINAHNNGRHAVPVRSRTFSRASACHHELDQARPGLGVAYDESAFRTMAEDAGLIVAEMAFGRWSNGHDVLGLLQDALLCVKPLALRP